MGAAEFKAAADGLQRARADILRKEAEQAQRLAEFDLRIADTEQKVARRGGGTGGPVGDPFDNGGRSIGAMVANSDALREFKASGYRGTSRVETKATITSSSVSGALGGLVAPDRAGVQPTPRRPLTIRSLCRNLRTESNQVTLMVQNGRVNAANPAPEGTLKGEGSLEYVEQTFRVITLATWVPVTRQALDDAVGLQALIDSELRYNLAEKEEDQLAYGNGTGDNLKGLMPQATDFEAPFTVADETPFDRLLQALAQASVANFRPSAIVLNMADAFRLHSIKDGQGRYIGGGPYEGLVNLLWSIPWVGTNALAPNDFLVGDFNAAEIYDRLDTEVLITDSHADFFVKNLYAIRAEQRLAFVVRDPRAFVKGNLITP
ncbi:phage major capsid protein [Methylobacterium sp. CM6257]